ncbi:MAG TPA: CDP-alcohol phosphatidyltransferase family protein [Acidimicrobiales bacterium]|nr:CDP-alcohol phosphatidyltransferase family protein [Acidimicrobiales bacterium]
MSDHHVARMVDVPPDPPSRPAAAPIGQRVRELTFGPSALVTPANGITVARLLATPALVVMVALRGAGWTAFAIAFAIGATDGIDGWLARRQGTTRSGAFLDPLADKVVVLSALFVLAAKAAFSWLPVALVALRETSMSAYRAWAGRRGVSIPARMSAKVKTLVQGVAILLALAPPVGTHKAVLSVAIWVAVAFTVVTGVQYLVDGRRAARAGRAP